ncbi:GNAT family N-acetyltransferase [Lysobacter niastensis]|uniref:GNAT family N-acetyltransferase n=1 Tax=Lysobacter niastensis TaxID=380629 RepID=A0ABS0BA86_9GAMM|nr:GNAT family N-acetyltransferase [Lysobacter niastensis]MBF6024606.1 GNAT family N-acetyltransferase [Lysobacter niastensis]
MNIERTHIDIGPLGQGDLPEADRIFRLAFGTFLGLPDPMAFADDADLVTTRWHAAPHAALGAYANGVLIGSNFAAHWGSFGFFGPLTVHPDYWDRGVARLLLAETVAMFERRGTRQTALFTFPHSAKHVGLYQKYDYWPQQLTAVMSKAVEPQPSAGRWQSYSGLADDQRAAALSACHALADAVYPGLDLTIEIESAARQRLGDTVLVLDGADLVAFAVCHIGKGSEAGSDCAYVKFGAARPGADAARHFDRLLLACESLASQHGATRLLAGVNTSRFEAYRQMLARGFKTQLQGVAMLKGNAPGYNLPDRFVIDDWR